MDPQVALGYFHVNQQSNETQNQLCCMLEITIPVGMRVLPLLSMKSDYRALFEILLPDKTKVIWNQEETRKISLYPRNSDISITTFKLDVFY